MQHKLHEAFRKFSNRASKTVGSPWTFMAAFLAIILWGFSGPIFGFSDTWQLVINTSTTIVTFLMVFIIQNTQNRDNEAVQLKLDELIRSIKNARNSMMDLEELSDEELNEIQNQFNEICTRRANQNPDNSQAGNSSQDDDSDEGDDLNNRDSQQTGSSSRARTMVTRN